jgi:hypothetical protein
MCSASLRRGRMARSGWGHLTLARVAAPAMLLALDSSATQAAEDPRGAIAGDEARALPPPVLRLEDFGARGEHVPPSAAAPLILPLDRTLLSRARPAHPVLLSLDVGIRYVRLIFAGDSRSPFRFAPFPVAPFLGTSSATLGGLRLRF